MSGKPGTSVTGGAFYDYDPKYFQNTILKGIRSSELWQFQRHRSWPQPKAKARGMDFFAWDLNNAGPALPRLIPNYGEITEIDVNGRRTPSPCFNHPDYQAFLRGKVESLLLRGYPSEIDGIAWGLGTCGASGRHARRWRGRWCVLLPVLPGEGPRAGHLGCWRPQAGFRELSQLFQAGGSTRPRPADGYFVSFWRILLQVSRDTELGVAVE